MAPINVMVTGAGSVPAQCALRALKRQTEFDVKTLAADMNPLTLGSYLADAAVQLPPADHADFVKRTLAVVEEHGIELLIPIIDYEFLPLAKARTQFAKLGCTLSLSEPAALEVCLDKYHTAQFLRDHDLGAPRTWLPESLPGEVAFPLFVKPRHMGRGSIGAHWVHDAAELAFHLERGEAPVVQEALEGRFLAVDVLCGLEGGVVGALTRELDEFKAGVVTRGRTVDAPLAVEACVRAAQLLEARGPLHFQLFLTDAGPQIIEINARFPAGLSHAVAAGFDMPLCLLRMLRGQDPGCQIGGYPPGVRLLRYFADLFVDDDGNPLGGEHPLGVQ